MCVCGGEGSAWGAGGVTGWVHAGKTPWHGAGGLGHDPCSQAACMGLCLNPTAHVLGLLLPWQRVSWVRGADGLGFASLALSLLWHCRCRLAP